MAAQYRFCAIKAQRPHLSPQKIEQLLCVSSKSKNFRRGEQSDSLRFCCGGGLEQNTPFVELKLIVWSVVPFLKKKNFCKGLKIVAL